MSEEAQKSDLPDFDAAWNYSDPVATRSAFEELLASNPAAPLDWRTELQTQIARTHSLKREFDEAHARLDALDIPSMTPRVHARYLLERGRAFNSAGEKDKARPLFEKAFEEAGKAGADYFTIDAAHMMAIVAAVTQEGETWAAKGLEIARASDDPKARGWAGPITNNLGWDAFDAGTFEEALALFVESEKAFVERDAPERARIARWAQARTLRAIGRLEDALKMQKDILAEHEEAGTEDGYVFEELAELSDALGDEAAAKTHAADAVRLLGADDWFVENEAERFARLKALAEN